MGRKDGVRRSIIMMTLATILGSVAGKTQTLLPAGPESAVASKSDSDDDASAAPNDDNPSYADTLVVTASRVETSIREAPVAISVLDSNFIETSTADNYADLLRGIPGLSVVQLNNRDVNMTPRGAAGVLTNDQLVLVDGRSIFLNYLGVIVWDYLPLGLDDIRQIEVVRGPGSAIWGANALTGVINIITKSPRELDRGRLTLEVGENGTRQASLLWSQVFDLWSYKVSSSYYEQDAWGRRATLPSGLPLVFQFDNPKTEQPNVDVRLERQLGHGRLWMKAGYGGTTGIVHSQIGPFLIEKGTRVETAEVHYQGDRLEAKIYWNGLRGNAPSLVSGLPFRFVEDSYVLDLTGRRPVGDRQLWTYGITARANRFDLSIAPDEGSRNDYGTFVENSILLSDKVTLNLGLRWDRFDNIGPAVSPRMSLIYSPNRHHAFRISFNQAYRPPAQLENHIDTVLPNAFILPSGEPFFYSTTAVGNRELVQTEADAFDIGYTGTSGRTTITASLYRNETVQQVNFVPSKFFGPENLPPNWPLAPQAIPELTLVESFSYLNFGQITNQGFELGLLFELDGGLAVSTSYTYQDQPKVSNNHPFLPFNANLPPRHQASLRLDLQRDRWSGALATSYTDDAFWTDVLDERFWGPTSDFVLVDASLNYRFRNDRYQLTISGTNLLNSAIQQHAFGDVIRRRVRLAVRVRWR